MKRALTLCALLLAAACSQKDSDPVNESANATEAPAAEKQVPLLEGNWQVASLDGRPVPSGSAMTATFKAGRLVVSSGCLRRAWTYTQNKNVVAFTTDPGGSTNCGGGTSSEQETTYAALTEANIAIFNKDGTEASLSGTGGNVTLRR